MGEGGLEVCVLVVEVQREVLGGGLAALGEGGDPGDHARGELDEVLVGGRGERDEGERVRGARAWDEEAIGYDRVDVGIAVQRGPKPLDKGNRARVTGGDPEAAPPEALPGEQGAKEEAEGLGEEAVVKGEGEAEGPREGQDKLAVGYGRENSIDQVRGRVGHAPAPARGAQPPLATERDEALLAAGRAAQAGEAAGQDAALEIALELVLDEARVTGPGVATGAGLGEEGGEVLADHLVEHGLLRLAAAVAGGQGLGRRAGLALVDDGREGRAVRAMAWVAAMARRLCRAGASPRRARNPR